MYLTCTSLISADTVSDHAEEGQSRARATSKLKSFGKAEMQRDYYSHRLQFCALKISLTMQIPAVSYNKLRFIYKKSHS
jgi:hypothetical protein